MLERPEEMLEFLIPVARQFYSPKSRLVLRKRSWSETNARYI